MTGSSPLAATQLDTDGALWLGRCRFSSVVSKNDFSLCSPKENRHTVHKKAMKPFESDPACQEDDKGMRDPFDGRSGVDRVAQRRRRDKKKNSFSRSLFSCRRLVSISAPPAARQAASPSSLSQTTIAAPSGFPNRHRTRKKEN